MARIPCGSVIAHFSETDVGTAGCLVQFPGELDKLYLLTAGHVVWSGGARQGDLIEAKDLPGQRFGELFDWSVPDDAFTTTDAALIRVDPALVSPDMGTGPAPKPDPNLDPKEGDVLTIFALGDKRSGKIRRLGVTKDVPVTVFGQKLTLKYQNQIECDSFTTPGCSGAMAVDQDNRIVGMVVAGEQTGTEAEPAYTLITPIGALLSDPAWDSNDALQICTAIPAGATFVPAPPPTNPVGKPAFLAAFTALAAAQSGRLGLNGQPPGIDHRIILAQAALETGWGKHAPDNNYFGIKGQGRKLKTLEADGHGGFVQIEDSFRGFASPQASFIGYADFLLANRRYGNFLQTGRSGRSLEEQTAALQASGYATDPNYGMKVLAIAQGIDAIAQGIDPIAPSIEQASGSGPYVAANPEAFLHQSVPNGQCVAYVQKAANAPLTSNWRRGAQVKGNAAVRRGTAIATFDPDVTYGNHTDGRSHAAIYLAQDATGLTVLDQWVVEHVRPVQQRVIGFGGPRPVDDGDAFFVIL